jgi:hypothetical protein
MQHKKYEQAYMLLTGRDRMVVGFTTTYTISTNVVSSNSVHGIIRRHISELYTLICPAILL